MEINQGSQEHVNNKFTSSDIDRLSAGITEERFSILREIYDTPGIQPKTLSEKLNKKPNALSNLIHKINGMDFELIQTEKNGTGHHYSLTDIARQYVEHKLLVDRQFPKDAGPDHSKSTETITSRVIKTVNLFTETCGPDWRSILDDLLGGKTNTAVTAGVQIAYNDLSATFCSFRKQDHDALRQVLDALEDEWLAARLTEYLDQKFVYFDFLEPLLTPARLDSITRFKIIDNVFSELHPSVFAPYPYEEPRESLLTPGEYNNLLLGILKLSNEFLDNHYSKDTAVSNWKAYFLTEELAFYIAEKCSLLKILHKLIAPWPAVG